jgi:peptide/nickel transport system substrate-binding protein
VSDAVAHFPELQSAHVLEPGTGVEVALNTRRGPLESLAVRQAALLAWDVSGMLAEVWDGQPEPTPGLNVPLLEWLPDFEAKYGAMFGDPEAARALLGEAALTPEGYLTIRVGEFGERYIRAAQSLADAMAAVGFTVEVQPVTTRIFAENVWLGGDYDIFVGPPLPVSSLTGQLFGIYHSDGPWNTTGYSTAELDRLIERQSAEMDPQARGELVLRAQDEIMRGAHRFYAATGVSHWLWGSNVRDLVPNTAGADTSFLTRVWLDRLE